MFRKLGLNRALLVLVALFLPAAGLATGRARLSDPAAAASGAQPAAAGIVISAAPTLDASESYAWRSFEFLGLAPSTIVGGQLSESNLPAPAAGAPVLWYITDAAAAQLTTAQLDLLRSRLQAGASGFVGNIGGATDLTALADPNVVGVASLPASTPAVSRFTTTFPDLTRQLTGVTFGHAQPAPGRYIQYTPGAGILPLVEGTGAAQGLARALAVRQGSGSLVLQGAPPNAGVVSAPLSSLLGGTQKEGRLFAAAMLEAVPLLLWAKWAAGDAAWHGTRRLANLTIDDPPPAEPFWGYQWTDRFYENVLEHARLRNFHITVGTIPAELWNRTSHVLSLFRQNPDRLSLIMHGHSHACPDFAPSLTAADLLGKVRQSRQWLEDFSAATGIPHARVMLYPCNAYTLRDAQALKRWNFVAISNETAPTDAPSNADWGFAANRAGAYPGTPPVFTRREAWLMAPQLDLALDRPVIGFYHPDDLQTDFGAFDPWADQINATGPVDWASVGEITQRHVWQKRNQDGSYSARLFSPDAIVENPGGAARTYHVELADDGRVPVAQVLVDGTPAAYTIAGGAIQLTLDVGGGAERRVRVLYREPSPGEYTLPAPAPSTPQNVLTNGAFNAQTDGWAAWHGDVAHTPAGRSGGGAKLAWRDPGPSAAARTTFTLSNWPGAVPYPALGETFAATAWVKGEGAALGRQAWLVLREHNDDGSVQESTYGTAAILSAGWQQVIVQRTVKLPQTTNLDIIVEVRDGAPGAVVYIDDVTMSRGPLAPGFSSGEIWQGKYRTFAAPVLRGG